MSSADIRRAAVLGSPISHSLSPAMHRAAYAALGLEGWTYAAIEVDAAGLPGFVAGLGPEWVGLSVTMPGKAAAAAVAETASERVRRLGVANTLVRQPDGWFAENTDVDGVLGALAECGVRAPRLVLVLGGGGTALAVLAALAELGVEKVVLAGRRPSSTEAASALAVNLGLPAEVIGMDTESVRPVAAEADLVMSAVPAGGADHLAEVLAAVPALFDAIYHPWPTAIAAAGGPGRRTITGLDMLLHQAFRQVELMTGRRAPQDAMRTALAEARGL